MIRHSASLVVAVGIALAVGLASPVLAESCASPADMAGEGLVVEFSDGAVETYRRRGDGLIESQIADSFGTATDFSRYGLFLVEGVEITAQGNRDTYSETYAAAETIRPPAPGQSLRTRSTSYSDGVEQGTVNSVWQAGQASVSRLGPCDYRAYLIDVSNTPMHKGAVGEKQRYLYLPEFEAGILLEVRFVDEDWSPLELPSVVRGQ